MAAVEVAVQGQVLNIQRLSTDDGPGLRTTAFLKGCSLSCPWCHNPESISFDRQLQWLGVGCLGCRTCITACKKEALGFYENRLQIDRNLCDACGDCVEACPTAALEILGTEWNAGLLAAELAKDEAYFGKDGGVTLSGGEAALQSEFVVEVLQECRSRGIPTALDTCGQVPWKSLEQILPLTDIVLYDLKIIDPEAHRHHTGADNIRILENARKVAALTGTPEGPSVLWIRTPIIPGATDSAENIRGIGDFIAGELMEKVSRWELCAFNNLCQDKYERLGRDWIYAETLLMEQATMEELADAARSSDVDESIVSWNGRTRR